MAAIVGAYKGLNAGGGPSGVGPGRQRVGDRRVHAALLRQRRHHRDLLPSRPTPGALMAIDRRAGRAPSARAAATPSSSTATSCSSTSRRCCGCRARSSATRARSPTPSPRSPSAPGGLTLIAGSAGVIAFLAFFAGTEVGIQGYASLSQIGVAKFSAFISAYFNTREVAPLISLDRARGDRRLRLHRPPRRDADLGGDRRPRGDGDPVAAVPGDHPDDRRVHRGDPAVRRGAERVVPLAATDHDLHLRAVAGHLRPLLPAVPAADRHALVVLQAALPRGRRDPHPLLLRLHRVGRPGRRRAWPWAGRSAPASSRSWSPTSSSASRSGARPRR